MDYDQPEPISRTEIERQIATDTAEAICPALVSAALFEGDWRWVEALCLRMARDPRPDVRACAVVSLGHLARIHGALHVDQVIPLLNELVDDPQIGGRAEDALDDIRMFIGSPQREP